MKHILLLLVASAMLAVALRSRRPFLLAMLVVVYLGLLALAALGIIPGFW